MVFIFSRFIRAGNPPHWRSMSYNSRQRIILNSKQGESVEIDCHLPAIDIQISSAWQEHCDIEYCSDNVKLDIKDELSSKQHKLVLTCPKHITEETPRSSIPLVQLVVPELFDLSVRSVAEANISFVKKVLGDVSIDIKSGRVFIEQLRGEQIRLNCNTAHVEVNKKLEGNIAISCQTLVAQMLHGNSVEVSAQRDVTIKALYCVSSSLLSKGGAVNVNLLHGDTEISSNSGCSLSGVDGSFIINNSDGNLVSVQVNKLYPGSQSVVINRNGSITALLDPEVVTKLNCTTRNDSCISVESDGFERTASTDTSCEGLFSGASSALKRPLPSTRKLARNSGKISVHNAELLSLRSTIKSNSDIPDSATRQQQEVPSLSLLAENSIKVESVSWIGKIMKKYDM